MELRAIGITMDCQDPERLADFWQEAIGFRSREGHEPYITLSDSEVGKPLNHLTLQKVPEGKLAKHRVHLDLFVRDPNTEVERLVKLGARVLTSGGSVPGHLGFVAIVMCDPEDGEFCVVGRPGKSEI